MLKLEQGGTYELNDGRRVVLIHEGEFGGWYFKYLFKRGSIQKKVNYALFGHAGEPSIVKRLDEPLPNEDQPTGWTLVSSRHFKYDNKIMFSLDKPSASEMRPADLDKLADFFLRALNAFYGKEV